MLFRFVPKNMLRGRWQEVRTRKVNEHEHRILVVIRVSFIDRCRTYESPGLLLDEVDRKTGHAELFLHFIDGNLWEREHYGRDLGNSKECYVLERSKGVQRDSGHQRLFAILGKIESFSGKPLLDERGHECLVCREAHCFHCDRVSWRNRQQSLDKSSLERLR